MIPVQYFFVLSALLFFIEGYSQLFKIRERFYRSEKRV